MQINDDKKIEILLNLLNERYNASHRMRERSLNFALWILGFGIAMAWMLVSQITLTFPQKIIVSIFVIIVGCLTKKFLASIEAGFDRNRNIMIKIEEVLGCYKANAYCEDTTLFPKEYKNLDKKETSHFKSLYQWVWAVIGVLISLIWFESILNVIKRLICK